MKVIRVSKIDLISRGQVAEELFRARSLFSYVKFILHNEIYITVFYNRDFTVEIATNSRNLSLWHEMNMLGDKKIQARVIDFVYKWLLYLNKLQKGCLK